MKPSLAFPYHDPDGKMFPHLQAILPDLKKHFSRAYICPPVDTRKNATLMASLEADEFFHIFYIDQQLRIGEHFKHLYLNAALVADPNEMIHLAYVDRLSFAVEGIYRDQFLATVDSLTLDDLPLIFQRSPLAWATHPKNYARLEGFVTQVGEKLFGNILDYAWCHSVVQAGELREVMPKVKNPDLSMVAEMILHMQSHIQTREVDWLAWEDPFILCCNSDDLRAERENSVREYEARLSYCLPMIETLIQFDRNSRN